MKAITVCVEYDDLLEITLPRAAPHFDGILVVTSPEDKNTMRLVGRFAREGLRVGIWPTNAFYQNGAGFNKGLALEQGFDILGREGWICVFDADIVMPAEMDLSGLVPGKLYCPRRRICKDPRKYDGSEDFRRWKPFPDMEHAGYCQFFHADDPVLKSVRPWYGTHWKHAGGCDSDFQSRWPDGHKEWLDFTVLHLGEDAANWHGRCTPRLDGTMPEGFQHRKAQQEEMLNLRRRFGGYAKEKMPERASPLDELTANQQGKP